ncbi:MAG: Crp/Fnr family transcriptional regulator [Vulcanimicrobiota bacterium]
MVLKNEMEEINFLKPFNREQKEFILSHLKKDNIKKKTVIHYQEAENCRFYEILKGQVKSGKITLDGREITMEILKEGENFGYIPLIDGGTCLSTATALTNVETVSLGKDEFLSILNKYPEATDYLIQSICQRMRKVFCHIEHMALTSVQKRVTRILLEMARQEGDYDENDILCFKIRLTHQELANLAGTTRETVTRVLASLKKEDLITVQRSLISITDEDKIEDYCYQE